MRLIRNWTKFAVDDCTVAKMDSASRIVELQDSEFGSGTGGVRLSTRAGVELRC